MYQVMGTVANEAIVNTLLIVHMTLFFVVISFILDVRLHLSVNL